jgi:hypothetical protein
MIIDQFYFYSPFMAFAFLKPVRVRGANFQENREYAAKDGLFGPLIGYMNGRVQTYFPLQ